MKDFDGKPSGKRPFGRSRHDERITLNWALKK
jgi:hypothetical protein